MSIQLPRDISESLLKSGVLSFTFSALFSGNTERALIVTAAAIGATLVNACVTPLFKKVLGTEHRANEWYHTVIQMVASIALTQTALNAFSRQRVDLISGIVLSIFLSLAVDGFKTRSYNHNTAVIFV
jgi:hypothetical protein